MPRLKYKRTSKRPSIVIFSIVVTVIENGFKTCVLVLFSRFTHTAKNATMPMTGLNGRNTVDMNCLIRNGIPILNNKKLSKHLNRGWSSYTSCVCRQHNKKSFDIKIVVSRLGFWTNQILDLKIISTHKTLRVFESSRNGLTSQREEYEHVGQRAQRWLTLLRSRSSACMHAAAPFQVRSRKKDALKQSKGRMRINEQHTWKVIEKKEGRKTTVCSFHLNMRTHVHVTSFQLTVFVLYVFYTQQTRALLYQAQICIGSSRLSTH